MTAGTTRAAEPLYETVVVAEAGAGDRARQDDAASSSIVTADRTPRSAEDLPQLLSELPGVSVTRLGGLGSMATLSLRGSSANQVEVYFDGVPLSAASGGGVDIGLIPVVDLDSVEVYRGMSPIVFGTSAMGGIVSLSSAAATDSGARAYAGGGSFGTEFAGVQGRWAAKNLRALGSVNAFSSAGDFTYHNDNATLLDPDPSDDSTRRRQNNALWQIDGLVHVVGLLPGRRQIWGTASFLHRDQGVPPVGSLLARGAALGTDRLIATAAYQSRDDLGLGSSLRAQLYTVTTWQRFHDPCGDLSGQPTQTRDLSTSSGATLAGSKPLAGWLRLSAIAEGRYERFDPSNVLSGAVSIPPGSRTFAAGGMEARFLVQALRLAVIPSLRLEVAKDEITSPKRYRLINADTRPATYWLPNARLALVQWASEQVTLRANLGRYGRLPSTFERYGDTGQVLGNPSLVPETGTNADLGANWTRAGARLRLSLDGALFAAWAHDLIQFLQVGTQMRPGNVGRARILGAEFSATADWRRRFRFFGQTTFTDARDLEDVACCHNKQLPHRPRLRAYARPELRNLALAGRWRWGLYADLDVTSGNYLDSPNLVEVNPRVLFGAGGQISAPHWGLRLVASAQNLANTPVVDLVGYPLPGRSVFLTLQWSTPETNKEILE